VSPIASSQVKYFTPAAIPQQRRRLPVAVPLRPARRGDAGADLSSRDTLGQDNKPLAHLANYPDWQKEVDEKKLRTQKDTWQAGKFVHPHDACFDRTATCSSLNGLAGRVTKLQRLS
jgi:hypothetical protein